MPSAAPHVPLSPADFALLSPAEQELAIALARADEDHYDRTLFLRLFPDDGPLRRDLYPKHLEFFRAGKAYRERCMMAANRVGKTVAGAFEAACHLTGRYPAWWEGRRFAAPVDVWAAGKTNETTRDIVQAALLGDVLWTGPTKRVTGTGVIPGDAIGDVAWKQGVPDLVDRASITHVAGVSTLGFKSYQQGRGGFEGTAKHVIWLDEEPPSDVYGECLVRTATTGGVVMLTFTPLAGLSDVVLSFLPGSRPDA